MPTGKLLNLIFVVIGIAGSIYVLYSIFLRNVKKEISKSVEEVLLKKNAAHR